MSNIKLYLVRFERKDNPKSCFYKFGITHHYNVIERFNDQSYSSWHIKPICSAYGPKQLVEQAEKELLNLFPKNFWLEEKLSGVTEIVKMSNEEVTKAKKIVENYRQEWYNNRNNKG